MHSVFNNKYCIQGESDLTDLRTPMYQRVYKYLKFLDSNNYQALEKFEYIGTLEDTDEQCLKTIIKLVASIILLPIMILIGIVEHLTQHGKRFDILFGF